jgi:hypothetical protein
LRGREREGGGRLPGDQNIQKLQFVLRAHHVSNVIAVCICVDSVEQGEKEGQKE